MIDLLATMQVLLKDAGFTTRLIEVERASVVCFEDDTLMGFGCMFDDPAALLAHWKTIEASLLRRHAASFRTAGDKAWNVYCVFLTGAAADPLKSRQIRWIEEDLDRTRKVAAYGLASREDVVRALLPVLPLQHRAVLDAADVTQRLQARIRTINPKVSDVALDEDVPAVEVVRLLGGQS